MPIALHNKNLTERKWHDTTPPTISVPFFHLVEVGFPFVEASFVCKTGKVLHGLFLIDSGAGENVFNHEAMRTIDESWIEEDTHLLCGMDNKGEACKGLKLKINVGGLCSEEHFRISHNIDWTACFGKNTIIGLLGAGYLAKHGLTFDFDTNSLHSSAPTEFDYSRYSFACPMDFGFQLYGVPIVCFEKEGREYFCVADSGADMNVLTQNAMEQGADEFFHKTDDNSTVVGIGIHAETSYAKIKMKLISIGKKEGEVVNITDEDDFRILEGRECFASCEDESAPVLSGLFSTLFMKKRKWILDFKLGVIYAKAS